MVKKKLWLFLVLVLVYSSAAITYNETTNQTYGNTQTNTGRVGWTIQAKNMSSTNDFCNITKIFKYPTSTPNTCRIYTSDGTSQLQTGSFSGNACTVNYQVTWNAKYWLELDSGGSSNTDAYVNIPGYFPRNFETFIALVQTNSAYNPINLGNTSDYIQSFFGLEMTCYDETILPNVDISLDRTFNGTTSLFSNVSCIGTDCSNAQYHLYDLEVGLIYNGTTPSFNYTSLVNNTLYHLRWNASIVGDTDFFDFNITTLQTVQVIYNYCLDSFNNTEEILEVLNMIPIVMLYIFFMYFSYYLIVHRSILSGLALSFLSFGLDFYMVAYFYETYIQPLTGSDLVTRIYGLFGFVVLFWLAVKLIYYVSLSARVMPKP